MLRKLITPLALIIFGLISFSAQAGIEKGDKTISIFGSVTSPDQGDDFTMLSLAGGMFVTETLEAQGVALILDGSGFNVSSYGANANLYFPSQNPDVVPFVGAGLTVTFLDIPPIDETEVGFNLQAGIKQFINESVSINYQIQLIDAGDYEATIASVGFSIFLD